MLTLVTFHANLCTNVLISSHIAPLRHHNYKFMAFYMYTRIQNICTGMSAQRASEVALQKMADRVKGHGGVVTVSKDGDIGKHFTTERMAWAWIKAGKLHYGLNCGEDFIAAE